MKDGLGMFVLVVVMLVLGFGCNAGLRSHGIDSCRERGGTPVVSSWLSGEAWDVKCIEKSSDGLD